MIVGFTGTKHEPTDKQKQWLNAEILKGTTELHHGACLGADAAAHWIALKYRIPVRVHPPEDKSWAMNLGALNPYANGRSVAVFEEKPYLVRNRDIVDTCDKLIALPRGPKEWLRSGTWATVRYALKIGKPVTICWPDGRIERR